MNQYEILKHYFGYDTFRDGQEKLIHAILEGRDVLGIMPTGAGKSLCYQIPALMMGGITLVVSPLISLMKDQVSNLNQAGILAAYLNSSLTPGQYRKVLELARTGRYPIIYVAPERLVTEDFLRFALDPQVNISMVAVDEAHCVSQWGQDFRPSYLKIVDFIKRLPKRPVVSAFTAMDLEYKTWSQCLINGAGLDINKFPKLLHSHELAGVITETGAADTGYLPGTKVYAGTGDAGATTLASGILSPGEYNVNLGTSSWVAAVSKSRMDSEGGGFNLAAMQKNLYITVVPFLNGGNVHRFIARILSRELDHKPDFAYISHLLKGHVPGSHGVFFLPYLTGERFPIMDSHIRASFLGLSQDTSAADMAGSVLEGVAFSIRHGLELFNHPAVKLSIIGGGARELAWCQILSNVMGLPVHVYKDPDLLPALAIASSVFLAEGIIPDYQSFIHVLEEKGGCTVLNPNPDAVKAYEPVYRKYKTIYPMVCEFYHEV